MLQQFSRTSSLPLVRVRTINPSSRTPICHPNLGPESDGHSKAAETTSMKSNTSTISEDPLALFSSVIASIAPHSLTSLAIRVREKKTRSVESDAVYGCTVVQPPTCGSFNLIYTFEFSDGVKWIMRIPAPENKDTSPRPVREFFARRQ